MRKSPAFSAIDEKARRLTFILIFGNIKVVFMHPLFLETIMPKRLPFLFLAILVICCTSSDSRKEKSTPRSSQETTVTPVPNDLRIVFGDGGGFSGQWKGYTVTKDGSVSSWQGRMAEENPKPAAKLSSNRIQELWNSVNQARYFERVNDETGNMTMFMVITANGKLHRISWAKTGTIRPELAPIQRLFDTCHSIVTEQK